MAPRPTSFPHLAEAQGTGLSLEGVRRPGVRPQQAGPEGKVAFDEPGFGCWRGPGHASRAASPGSSVTGAAHRAVQVAKGPGRVHRAWRPAHSRCPGTIVPLRGSHCPFLSLVSSMENKATLGAT